MKININGKSLEIADEDLKKAIDEKKESIELKADTFIVRTSDEDLAYKENVRREGITIGAEVGRKNLIKALGIEGDGLHKSDETSVNAITGLITSKVESAMKDAKIEPDKKILEKEKDIKTLQGTIAELQSKKTEIENSFTAYKKTSTINNMLNSLLPENIILPKEDMLQLMSGKIKADINEQGVVVALDEMGEVIKDKTTLNPVPFKSVVADFFGKNPQYLKGATGGAGGGDSGAGAGKQDLDSFTKEMSEKGVRANSAEFIAEMQTRMKAGSLKV